MKIVILADSIATQNTGIHFFGVQLVRMLQIEFSDHQYILITPKRIQELDFEQIIVPIRKWIPLHLRLRQIWTIPWKVRKLKPDMVIELAHFGPFFLPSTVKRITVIHDLTPVIFPKFHGAFSSIIQSLTLPGILNRADYILCNSLITKTDLIARYFIPEEKVFEIHPRMEFESSVLDFKIIKEKYALKQPYFLSIGTIEPRKDYLTSIKAFEIFAEKDLDFQFVICGKDGWKNNEFYKYVKKSKFGNRIILPGYVERNELLCFLENAQAYISSSNYEGFGLPILEAQKFGLPLILTDIPASKEIAKSNVMFYPVKDYEKLVQCMEKTSRKSKIQNIKHEKSITTHSFKEQLHRLKQIFGQKNEIY